MIIKIKEGSGGVEGRVLDEVSAMYIVKIERTRCAGVVIFFMVEIDDISG
jgi:hypothetical protein